MTGRAQQDAPAHRGAAGRLPSREGAVAASLPATADYDRGRAEWRERALAAEARVRELEQTLGELREAVR